MSTYRNLITLCVAVVFTLGLAACGGGGGGTTTEAPPPTYTVALPDGHGLMPGTTTLPQGDTVVGDTTISCPSADGCELTVSKDPVTGAYTATATGGMVTVAVAMPPPPPDPALTAAQTAAMTAAGAAKTAYDAAMAALAAVESIKDDDMASYDMAMAEVAKAQAAYMAAKAASDAAAATTVVSEAEGHQLTAEAELVKANAANTAAMNYAGMVQTAYNTRIANEAAAEAAALADARSAARMAWQDARNALAALAGKQNADPASYERVVNAVADARAAYQAALAAATSTEAEGHQADAEDALADATAFAAMVVAAHDAPAIMAAQTAAMTASDAANAAYEAAKAALAGVEAIKDEDMTSYDAAVAQVAAAKAAAAAAKAASDAAATATLLGDAQTQQTAAQNALAAANAANTAAAQYAGLVQTAYDARIAEEAAMEMAALTTAQTAAQGSYDTAKMLHAAAKERFDALADKRGDDVDGNWFRALDALARAQSAYNAAATANTMAQAATTSTDAMTHQAAVESAAADVRTATGDVALYAGLVEAAYNAAEAERQTAEEQRLAEEQRMEDVAAARTAAMQSYMDADADATKAETAAAAAEETASATAGAMAARAAATAARAAANMAKAAHDAITDEMTKAEADEKANDAAVEAGKANSSYMIAKAQNDAVQTAHMIASETQRVAAVTAAQMAANAAVTDAETAKNNAAAAAMAAETARDNAKAALDRARDARTGVEAAMMQYEAAKTAAMMARDAATAAEAAYMAAKTAADGIDDAGTANAAQMAQGMAEDERDKAQTAAMTAETEQGKAEDAETAAMTASGTHVLQLFMAANGAHVMDGDDEGTDANAERADHVTSVGAAMAAIANATEGNQGAGTTATVVWPGDTVDDPDTADTDESSEGMRSISVGPGGATALPFELGADRAADDTATPPVTARIQTANEIAGLSPRFQGYEIWEDDGDADTATDRGRVIVFTDKTQDKSPVEAAAAVTARSVLDAAITTPGELSNVRSSGRTITGVTWTPSGEGAMTGTLSCPANTACSITLGDDGAVTAISGYTFTGSREAKAAVTACDATCQATANNNYLVFGLWLDEDTTTDPNTNTFGSFAAGGAPDAIADAVTGTASYIGKAAGAHHKTGEGVNWFDGDASLTANFGAADAAGNVSGEISNIRVNGGEAMSDSIYLRQTDLTTDTATFNGVAVMGGVTAPGASTYEFEGTWSGSFFGPTADDPATTGEGNDESITAPLGAAGTFGVTKSEGTGDDVVVESFVGAFGAHLLQ